MSIIRKLFDPKSYAYCPSTCEMGSAPVTVPLTQERHATQTTSPHQFPHADTNLRSTIEQLQAQKQTILSEEEEIDASRCAEYPLDVVDDHIRQELADTSTLCTPWLEINSTGQTATQWYQLNESVLNVGRHPGNDVVLNDGAVSNFHVQIVRNGKQFFLIHPHPKRTQTLNGLWFENQYIHGNEFFAEV